MQKKIDYLKTLFKIKETVLVPEYHTVERNFYSYLDKSGMSNPEYEAFIKELYKEGLIEIDLCGYNNFDHAVVVATKAAAEYIATGSRNSIGF